MVPLFPPHAPLPRSVSDNHTVTYGWDTAGRLTSVTDWASHVWTFSYDGANRLSGIQYPNGVNYTRGYNADGQLTNLVYSKSGTPFISRSFERNLAGLKTRETISAGLEVEQPDTWQKHTSDKADRLTGLARRDEYVIPERWRGYTPSYNQEGQVTNVSEGYRSWNSDNGLVWNDAGRLVEYTGLRQTNLWTDTPPMPSWGLELGYDGLGARTIRTDELVSHRLVVDRVGRLQVPLMETDDSNTAIRYYIWAPGIGLLAQIEANSTIHYIHSDEIGSTLAMTDSNGDVSDQFAYSPWGELLGRTGTNTTAFTFVGGGGVTWEGGGLYRMGARYYDARLKRWLSADPSGMAGGINLYMYCNGNPLFWTDPLGLCGQTYWENPGVSWDDQQSSVVLRATPQEQLAYNSNLQGLLHNNPGAEWEMADSPSLRKALEINQAYDQTMAVAGSMSSVRMAGNMPTLGESVLKGVDDNMFVHFSQAENLDSITANGVFGNGGASYFFRAGDVRGLTPAQVRMAVSDIAAAGADNSLAVISSPNAASFTREAVQRFPEYSTMQQTVPWSLIRQVPGGRP